MSERDYPAGAYDDPNAPYNEPVIPEIDVDVTISTTLSRTAEVTTDDYYPGYVDEEGHREGDNFSETNFENAYDATYYSIPELLKKLTERASKEKEEAEAELRNNPHSNKVIRELSQIIKEASKIINSANGWEVDETEVIQG